MTTTTVYPNVYTTSHLLKSIATILNLHACFLLCAILVSFQ
jgi:hypothetical protein